MIKTTRIASGFDIELQLGGRWFFTAINLLNDNGLLAPPGIPVIITNVQITFEPGWDLQIDVAGLTDPVFAKIELSDDGSEMTLTTSMPGIPPKTIPFGALKELAAPPVLVKLEGDEDTEPVMAILANLDIHAEPQSDQPLPDGEFFERGNPDDALSFLPLGKDVAFGMGKSAFPRFGNNIWHTKLRADDGTHPLPDADNKQGEWSKVSMKSEKGKIRIKLEGDIPVDSPLIDVIPDPHVTITLLLTPKIIDGKLTFSMETDTDVDTGLLGDLFGGITGGIAGAIIGFIVGLITGGLLVAVLVGAGIGVVVGVIAIEVTEVIIDGIVQKAIKAKLNGQEVTDIHCCKENIVQIATPSSDDGFNLSVLDSIPTSIAIHTENPDNEFLYKRSLLVTSEYDELKINGSGFGVAGLSGTIEKFQPEIVAIDSAVYTGTQLTSLTYKRKDNQTQELPIDEVFARAAEAELAAPFKIFSEPEHAALRIPEGKLACACMKPVSIHETDTVVDEIEFENGLKLKVPDAIALQDAAAIVVTGYQLIHPKDYHSYYRAKADFFLDNNFESLPKY
jgi:hypothetical protein